MKNSGRTARGRTMWQRKRITVGDSEKVGFRKRERRRRKRREKREMENEGSEKGDWNGGREGSG